MIQASQDRSYSPHRRPSRMYRVLRFDLPTDKVGRRVAKFEWGQALTLRQQLLRLYDEFPFEHHPLWKSVMNGTLAISEVVAAEKQHYIRTRAGQALRHEAMTRAKSMDAKLFGMLLQTYLEECTRDEGPSHLDLIERLCLEGGCTLDELAQTRPTPGNAAAIALYRDISSRGAGCHMLGAGAVEFYYSKLSPRIYDAYVNHYKMSDHQAETYRIHGDLDATHAERAFAVLDEVVKLHGWEAVRSSVRDAFVATSLHYDGMLQAARSLNSYWDGKS
jgi:pyrroloquinoline quinone (PQQ) biosynthesis protein C